MQSSVQTTGAGTLAESRQGCILLTGDRKLRRFARKQRIEVHGVLWVIDELHAHAISTAAVLVAALKTLGGDPTVRLPQQELAEYLKRYGGS
jgi:predicted nucleic acid-binding protein